jgi:hypothetical protein
MDGITAVRMDARSNRASKQRSLRQFQRRTPRRSHPPRLRQWGLLRALREYNVVDTHLVVYMSPETTDLPVLHLARCPLVIAPYMLSIFKYCVPGTALTRCPGLVDHFIIYERCHLIAQCWASHSSAQPTNPNHMKSPAVSSGASHSKAHEPSSLHHAIHIDLLP